MKRNTYTIKYINLDTAETKEFKVTSHRDLEVQLENAEISEYSPFWKPLGTSDKIPVKD